MRLGGFYLFLVGFIHSWWSGSIIKSAVQSLGNQMCLLKDEVKTLTAHKALKIFECLVIYPKRAQVKSASAETYK